MVGVQDAATNYNIYSYMISSMNDGSPRTTIYSSKLTGSISNTSAVDVGIDYVSMWAQSSKTVDLRLLSASDTIEMNAGTVNINGSTFVSAGDITLGRDLIVKNGYSMFCKNSSGTQVNALHMNSSNQMIFGYGAYTMGYVTRYAGAAVEIGTPQGNFRPYFRPGDSITVRWRGAGFVTGSGTDIVYAVPLAKPAVGCSGVTVATADGFIIRQNDKYCYGSTSSTQVKNITSHNAGLAGDSHVRIITGFTNNTNVTNNSAIGIDASVIITFV
jgi:hypothetical protein